MKDNYCPAEEGLGTHPFGTFLRFEDFNLSPEKDIFFVDDIESELYVKATTDLLNARFVGIDSEFKPSYTKFAQGGVSTLQLATPYTVYIFDVLAFDKSKVFTKFVLDLFLHPNIIKVKSSFLNRC